MSPLLLISLCGVLLASGRADEVREEQTRAHEQRVAQETALALLKSQKVGVTEVMDLYAGLAKASALRQRRLEGEMTILRRRVELATWEEGVARGVLDDALQRLGPKLFEMYRLSHEGELSVLLSAKDFAALMWRSRAYRTLLRSDLALLAKTRDVAAFESGSLRKLDALKAAFDERLDEAEGEAEAARAERAELGEALTLVQAEASASDRVLRELKSNETQLDRALADLTDSAPQTAFGRLKGRLPFPAKGFVERGFGNVLNPRFNTVTLHKGLDIRAGEGQSVRAIADGRVVYAGWLNGYGNLVIVEHEAGYHTVYAHLGSVGRAVGQGVRAGDELGRVGDTGSTKGAYLYFELRQRGIAVDPAAWLKADEE